MYAYICILKQLTICPAVFGELLVQAEHVERGFEDGAELVIQHDLALVLGVLQGERFVTQLAWSA